jgi:hypothetical protein
MLRLLWKRNQRKKQKKKMNDGEYLDWTQDFDGVVSENIYSIEELEEE